MLSMSSSFFVASCPLVTVSRVSVISRSRSPSKLDGADLASPLQAVKIMCTAHVYISTMQLLLIIKVRRKSISEPGKK